MDVKRTKPAQVTRLPSVIRSRREPDETVATPADDEDEAPLAELLLEEEVVVAELPGPFAKDEAVLPPEDAVCPGPDVLVVVPCVLLAVEVWAISAELVKKLVETPCTELVDVE